MSPTLQHSHGRKDRRSGHRFPIEAELYYLLVNNKVIKSSGHGTSVNISSNGILFESSQSIRLGLEIELSIAWPARIDGVVHLQLHASGRTVRKQDNCTGVHVLRYEFRTGAIREPKL
ncbi:MAG TPA: PilZ domain-containing protein [Bryobacteraceae bacterium]|nr:PilZ domain-containing protein [Bryobacteraceae bacterium]